VRKPRSRVRRGATRPPSVALHEMGCTCEPEFYVVDETHLRIEHEPDRCLLIISGVSKVEWDPEPNWRDDF
jgi:hypothetical protein